MTSEKEKLDTLLRALLRERPEFAQIAIPESLQDKRNLLRSLMNVRAPGELPSDVLAIQDEELATQREEKGVVYLNEISPSPLYPRLRLWQGDITRLAVDAIVNAAKRYERFMGSHADKGNLLYRKHGGSCHSLG